MASSWLEDPCVYTLLIPQELKLDDSEEHDTDAVTKRMLDQLIERCGFVGYELMPTSDTRFVEAVDATFARLMTQVPPDAWTIAVTSRERGEIEIARIDTGEKLVRFVRVATIKPKEEQHA